MAKTALAVAVCIILACSNGTETEMEGGEGLDGVIYIASDGSANRKLVEFADTVLSGGEDGFVYRETGIDFDWDMTVIYRNSDWQARRFKLTSETISADLSWDGDRVTGSTIDEDGAEHHIDRTVDSRSIHAWFAQSAFMGLAMDEEGDYLEFDMIVPSLDVYGYRADYSGTEGVATEERWFNCHRLDVDGRGAIGLFAADMVIYYRVEEPSIAIKCWVEGEGSFFEYVADTL